MKRILLCVAFATLLTAGNCPGDLALEPPQLQLDAPPPPIPDAMVVMTNSNGETVFEGTTNQSGRAEGTRGSGRMDHQLTVKVVLPDGKTFMDTIVIPPRWKLQRIYATADDSRITPVFIKPRPLRSDDESDNEREDDRQR